MKHRWALGTMRGLGWRVDLQPSSASCAGTSARSSAIDALRAGTMIGVVVLHSAMAYIRVPLPHLPWLVSEPASTLGFDLLCWWLLGVSMPIFFALGGFSAEAIFTKKGVRGFVVDRVARIGVPFVGALALVAIPTLLVWAYGWYISGRCSPEGFLSLDIFLNLDLADPELRDNSFGPAHLWFLEYMLLYLAGYIAVRRRRPPQPAKAPGSLLAILSPCLFAVPTTVLLVATHHFQQIDAVMNMHNSFVPDLWRLAHHGLFFLFGVQLYHHWPSRALLAKRWPLWAVVSLLAFAARAAFLRVDLVTPLQGPELWGAEASAAIFGWTSLFAALGLALDRFDRARPTIKRWADSSYWIYLVHFPVVSLIQADLFGLAALPATLKFAIVVAGTLVLGDLSHAAIVRPTVLGHWLGGGRGRRSSSHKPHVGTTSPGSRIRARLRRSLRR
jgi:hypothetical protein